MWEKTKEYDGIRCIWEEESFKIANSEIQINLKITCETGKSFVLPIPTKVTNQACLPREDSTFLGVKSKFVFQM